MEGEGEIRAGEKGTGYYRRHEAGNGNVKMFLVCFGSMHHSQGEGIDAGCLIPRWQLVDVCVPGSGTGWLPLSSCQGLQLPPGPAPSPSAFLTFRVSAWEWEVGAPCSWGLFSHEQHIAIIFRWQRVYMPCAFHYIIICTSPTVLGAVCQIICTILFTVQIYHQGM